MEVVTPSNINTKVTYGLSEPIRLSMSEPSQAETNIVPII